MGKGLPIDQNEVIAFQIHRNFNVAVKRFLNLLEDLQNEHQIHFQKLKENLPFSYESIINQADYFSEDKYSYLRKKVLDIGGECNRELQEELEKYHLELIRNEGREEIE